MADVASGVLGRWIFSRPVPIVNKLHFFFSLFKLSMCSKLIIFSQSCPEMLKSGQA